MMLDSLREATASLHKRLEANNLANKIIDHSISLEEYEFLLYQNFLAYSNAEREIAPYFSEFKMDKAQRLKKDLQEMGTMLNDPTKNFGFNCKDEAEALGAAYVIEGSAMGGMMIGKEIPQCPALSQLSEQNFFSGKREAGKGWNQYLKLLRTRQFTEDEIDTAVRKAIETFQLFEKAFNLQPAKS